MAKAPDSKAHDDKAPDEQDLAPADRLTQETVNLAEPGPVAGDMITQKQLDNSVEITTDPTKAPAHQEYLRVKAFAEAVMHRAAVLVANEGMNQVAARERAEAELTTRDKGKAPENR